MALSSQAREAPTRQALIAQLRDLDYENKIAERFGGQKELELYVPTPSTVSIDGARAE
jgi:hypothetical protein